MDTTSGRKRGRESVDLNHDIKRIKLEEIPGHDSEHNIAPADVPDMMGTENIEAYNPSAEPEAYAKFKKENKDVITAYKNHVTPWIVTLQRKLPVNEEKKMKLQRFLYWLENDAGLKSKKAYDDSFWALNHISDTTSGYALPLSYQQKALELKKRLEPERAAITPVQPLQRSLGRPRLKKLLSEAITSSDNSIPRYNHPIFREGGIMYGIKLCQGKVHRTHKIRTDLAKRDHNVFGHNDIVVGTWFPTQLCALMYGAHGSSQGGIAGSPNDGAYSVIISDRYEGIDEDRGNTLGYAGTHNQAQAEHTNATKTMFASIENKRPIRLLRAASRSNHSKSLYAPILGIRYDGLYKAVGTYNKVDSKGQNHVLFRLIREPGQGDLQELQYQRPTAQEQSDFTRIKEGY